MATFIVKVRNEPYLVTTKRSKTVWVASGAYGDERHSSEALTEGAAVTRWGEWVLEARRSLSHLAHAKRQRVALPREQLFRR